MNLEANLEFDDGDYGPSGGVQVREAVGRQMSERAADDRIRRYPGECEPEKAWPLTYNVTDNSMNERLDKLSNICERMRKNLVVLQKNSVGSASQGQGGLPTLSEGDSAGAYNDTGNSAENDASG